MRNIIIAMFLILSTSIFSQNGEKNFIDMNYIEVTGKAEKQIVPDLIYLKIILSDNDNKNKQGIEVIEKAMIAKFTELGIDVAKDLSVKDFDSNYKKYWLSKTNIVLTKEYQLIVHETKTLQKVYLEMQKLGISNVSIEKIDHSLLQQFRKEVKINAIKAAKEKAESLMNAVSQTIGKAIYVQEYDVPIYYNRYQNAISNAVSKYDTQNEMSEPTMDFEKIILQSSILVRFEIK
jgi:hypothetical protein